MVQETIERVRTWSGILLGLIGKVYSVMASGVPEAPATHTGRWDVSSSSSLNLWVPKKSTAPTSEFLRIYTKSSE